MAALVDALRAEVRGERRAWTFALDCCNDVAIIELGTEVYRVRPLSWREKRNLARYARLGEEFVRRHFLKMSLAVDVPLPTDPDEHDALHELARWMNAPGDVGSGLPLDSGLLASVTLAVARDTGARLADLEEQTADFVEQLWQSGAHHRAEPQRSGEGRDAQSVGSTDRAMFRASVLPDPGDMNRIVIVPDPPSKASTGKPGSEASPVVEEAKGVERSDPAVSTPSAAAGRPLAAPAEARPAPAADGPAPIAATPRGRFRVRFAEAAPARAAPLDSGSTLDITAPHSVGAVRPPNPSTSESTPTTARPSAPAMPTASPVDSTAPRSGVTTLASAVSPGRVMLPSPGFLRTEDGPERAFWEDARVADRARSQLADIAPLVRVEERFAVDVPSTGIEDLFDRWAERLESAAEQLGIDLEG